MTDLIHQLRARRGAIASALLFVLMATWLSVLCPDCGADSAEAPPPASHCHSEQAPTNSPTDDHGCCDRAQGGPCLGAACTEFSAVAQPEIKLIAPAGVQFEAVVPDTYELLPQAPPNALPARLPALASLPSCPLYLRHCAFLN